MSGSQDRVIWEPRGPSSWQLCDAAVPRSHPAHTLAHVEQDGDELVVTWISVRSSRRRFGGIDAITRVAVAALGAAGGGDKPFIIPHRAPFGSRDAS